MAVSCSPADGVLRDPGRLNGAEAEVNGRCTRMMHPVGTDRAEASIWPIWPYAQCPCFLKAELTKSIKRWITP